MSRETNKDLREQLEYLLFDASTPPSIGTMGCRAILLEGGQILPILLDSLEALITKQVNEARKQITSNAEIMSGELVIAGTRIPIERLLYIIKEHYPQMRDAKIKAVLAELQTGDKESDYDKRARYDVGDKDD